MEPGLFHYPEFGDYTFKASCSSAIDYAGRFVGRTISYDEFIKSFVEKDIARCHHFVRWGFLYDGIGPEDVIIGFDTRASRAAYWYWVKSHNMALRLPLLEKIRTRQKIWDIKHHLEMR